MQPESSKRIGPYRVIRMLGAGGMGTVFEAIQESIQRRVALKVLHPEFARNKNILERFFNEARAVNLIEHPSLVQITEFGEAEDGTAYIAMEYLRGESLAKRLERLHKKGGRLPTLGCLYVAWQIADALGAAHEKGIVHRDLKPDNVMLVPEPIAPGGERVKLLDFGIAKLANTEGRIGTAKDALMGTPSYMSPEQCRGAAQVDDRTDVYALGVMLYEILAGRPPFQAEGPGEIIFMHISQTPPPLLELASKAPTELIWLIHRLLTKDKAERPPMRVAQDAIERLLASTSGAHVPVRIAALPNEEATANPQARSTLGQSAGQGLAGTSRRKRLLIGASGSGALACLAIGIALRSGTKPVPSLSPQGSVPAATQPAPKLRDEKDREAPKAKEIDVPGSQPAPVRLVQWRVRSVPASANVLSHDGRLLGRTPWSHAAKGEDKIVVSIRYPGYDERRLTLSGAQDEDQEVTLIPTKTESSSTAPGSKVLPTATPSSASLPQKPAATPQRPVNPAKLPPSSDPTKRVQYVD